MDQVDEKLKELDMDIGDVIVQSVEKLIELKIGDKVVVTQLWRRVNGEEYNEMHTFTKCERDKWSIVDDYGEKQSYTTRQLLKFMISNRDAIDKIVVGDTVIWQE
jgi:hypothetical protein